MKVSYFETGRYQAPADMSAIWPMPASAYDTSEGTRVFQGMVVRIAFAEKLGFDWVSLSEHHYSPRILTPSPGSGQSGNTRLSCWLPPPGQRVRLYW